MKTVNLSIIVSVLMVFSFAFTTSFQQDNPWKIPEDAKKVKNPVEKNGENINMGKMFYSKHCKSCHGKNGEGDGPKSAELETFPGDFTSKEFQSQTDGAIYYKTVHGRDDMPSFDKKISNKDDIWAIIHYMRSFD